MSCVTIRSIDGSFSSGKPEFLKADEIAKGLVSLLHTYGIHSAEMVEEFQQAGTEQNLSGQGTFPYFAIRISGTDYNNRYCGNVVRALRCYCEAYRIGGDHGI
jgi:hypothetical protein